ncbi:GntR family transcriptional regulator [Ammoniphilus resinae]|uniref:DNA-binding GntR family transcriptional regulator n=1 Tax=Ammoniphilus resinae TaxID=861532 RepID=A0ABS4GL97_9BACL|nr:GntR family transcriptional regulator [Ammoniphilus resinae]MBP1931023.1 DNA-binding GntR family transcriptional regulator [Ammoniphilus resinae]
MKLTNPIKKATPLYQQAYKEIKHAILTGRIKPGEKIAETILADQLQISRTPIREAFRLLQTEGLLIVDHFNTWVMELSLDDFEELSTCRLILEREAIQIAIHCISEEDVRRLEVSIERSEEALNKGNHLEALEFFSEFHAILDCAVPNRRLTHMLEQIRSFLLLYRARTLVFSDLNHLIVEEHRVIFEAVKQKNLEKAMKAVEYHLRGDVERTREIFNQMI